MKSFLIFFLFLLGCSLNKHNTINYSERWIDYNDLELLDIDLTFGKAVNLIGEPIYIEHVIDSSTFNYSLIAYYNFRTKIYKYGERYNQFDGIDLSKLSVIEREYKPEKQRNGGPWGDIYSLQIYFTSDTLSINQLQQYKLQSWDIIIPTAKELSN